MPKNLTASPSSPMEKIKTIADKGKRVAETPIREGSPAKKARAGAGDSGFHLHWSDEELDMFIHASHPDGDGPRDPRISMQPGAVPDEKGDIEFPFLPARPDRAGFSAIASMQALYSSGTNEWHDQLVAEAFRRPPADFAAMHNVVACVETHASQTLTHTLAKEVARLTTEVREAGGDGRVKGVEAERDRALAEVNALHERLLK